jgi:hypothetical protein
MSVRGHWELVARRSPRTTWAVWAAALAALSLTATVVGWTEGAPATIGPGTTETAQGADVGEKTPAYWLWEATQLWHIPKPTPTALSTTPALPTLLTAASGSYDINSATAGNTSVRWSFQETTAAPRSTELELRFTDGLSHNAAVLTVYIETRATAPTVALTFLLYWDAGTFAPAGITVQTMQVLVQGCPSVGHCP